MAPTRTVDGEVPTAADFAACNQEAPQTKSIFSESETRIANDREDFFRKCLLLRVQRVCSCVYSGLSV